MVLLYALVRMNVFRAASDYQKDKSSIFIVTTHVFD